MVCDTSFKQRLSPMRLKDASADRQRSFALWLRPPILSEIGIAAEPQESIMPTFTALHVIDSVQMRDLDMSMPIPE